jgi:2-polyprenyl-3-methyl-5-hydroxy-6-metoxy-1,4-benzoquinol methylase
MEFIHYTNCPGCAGNDIIAVLEAKDQTVSGQLFQIWECANCTLRFTQGVPNANDIGAYYKSESYISHTNTTKGFINKLYHLVRTFTLYSKKKLVQKYSAKNNGNLLDIGAGTGAFASTMKKTGWQVTALEPDETARIKAKHQYNIALQEPEYLFGLQPASYNVITLWHVMEHVHELHRYLDTFYSLLVEGGDLIIAVPNYTSYDATVYSGAWAAYDVPRHLYHFSPESMKHLLDQHGFRITTHKSMWFDSFYISLLSEKYLTGRNRPFKAFLTGLISNLHALKNTRHCSSIIYMAKK